MTNLVPCIYQIGKDNETEQLYLTQYADKFKLPDVLYGNINKTAVRVWNTFAISRISTGILLTGESGSGKSLLGEVICNYAIDKGIPVIFVSNIQINEALMRYLTVFDNVVVFLDEMGKYADRQDQDKMLSFFSDTTRRKLFIITENNSYSINRYILNRPGRIRYHIDYSKVPKDIITDYLDKNSPDIEFNKSVYSLYLRSKVFSFDHLQALVTEHTRYPEDSLDDLVGILNLGILQEPYYMKVVSVEDLTNGKVLKEDQYRYNNSVKYDNWSDRVYHSLLVTIMLPKDKIDLDSRHFRIVNDGKYIEYEVKISCANVKYHDEHFTYEDELVKVKLTKYKQPTNNTESYMDTPFD